MKNQLTIIDHYILALDAIWLASRHFVAIENHIKDLEFSKKELEGIWSKLRKNLEKMTGKKAVDFDKRWAWRIKDLDEKEENK